MKKFFILFASFFFVQNPVSSWGFLAHKTINYAAVFTLPTDMFRFYRTHIEYIEKNAVKADMRRYINPEEAKRHYLDADFYEQIIPLDTLPHHWDSAVAKYSLDTLNAHGIVPWHLYLLKYQLTKAFEQRDYQRILRLSTDIGHYVGDLHVPLHSTGNYNGQRTNQHGVHGLWESRLVELNLDQFNLFTGKARYYAKMDSVIWSRFEQSFAAKDSVLQLELEASKQVGESKKFTFEKRGNTVVKTYSTKFCRAYDNLLNDMVVNRLRSSIELLGSLWFSAWVDAGQPKLNEDESIVMPEEIADSVILQHKILGREESH